MIIEGSFRVPVPSGAAWAHLAHLPGLVPLLPGCDAIEAAGAGEYRITAHAKVGPVKAQLAGKLSVMETAPGESLRLRMEGQDRLSGSHVRALMAFTLVPLSEGETEVRHSMDVIVSGRLAMIGQGIMRETVATMLEEFIRRLNGRITGVPAKPTGLGALSAKAAGRSLRTGISALFDRKET